MLIAGCEKHPLDYRNKFLGDYTFSVHYSWWDLINGSTDTTYTSDGKIWYGSDDHSVLIKISEGKSFEFDVYEDGTLGSEGFSVGEFESTRKIKFYWHNGGLGGGENYIITGDKK